MGIQGAASLDPTRGLGTPPTDGAKVFVMSFVTRPTNRPAFGTSVKKKKSAAAFIPSSSRTCFRSHSGRVCPA